MEIVLASQSPYRRAQLRDFGLMFKAEAPRVDEEALKRTGPTDLVELTRYLAEAKARSLIATFPNAVILGSDQIAEYEGKRLDKPGTLERARAQLAQLSGKEHRLITSLALIHQGRAICFTDITRIWFKDLDATSIDAYLAKDNPLDCAGSYKIEKAGLGLVASLETRDPSAIQGLPLISLTQGFQDLGLSLAKAWSE